MLVQAPTLLAAAPEPGYKYPFVDPADATTKLTVDLASDGVEFNDKLLGVNAQMATGIDFGWEDPRLPEVVDFLGITQGVCAMCACLCLGASVSACSCVLCDTLTTPSHPSPLPGRHGRQLLFLCQRHIL